MKTLTIIALLIVGSFAVNAQESLVTPKVDERTELLSIVFRLAGNPEYSRSFIPSYSKDIDSCFTPFKEHAAILFAKKMRDRNWVSYDAVMSMAINVEITDSIRFRANRLQESLDDRWTKENALKFLVLLNRFYFDSKFHEFFVNHNSLYGTAEKNFTELLKEVDFSWFQKFYGVKMDGEYNLVVSLANGGGNYGPNVKYSSGKQQVYAIIGSWETDSLGQPIYSDDNLPIIIHEYNHSYCNPVVEANADDLKQKGKAFYKIVSDKMRHQAYGEPKTMLYEIMVRACVIKYFEQNGASDKKVKYLVNIEKTNGFLWIGELVKLLSTYENNREKYPTLMAFMPEVVKLQNSLSPKDIKKDYESKCAQIVSFSIKNRSKNVDPKTAQLVVTFDRPMNTGNNGMSYGKQGKKCFPEFPKDVAAKWNEDTQMEWIIPVALKPNTKYSLSFPAQFFMDENSYSLKETYYLDFVTGKD